MKRILFSIAFSLLFAAPSWADAPAMIHYQGKLADSAGNPQNGSVPMAFHLYTSASGGSPAFSDTRTGGNSITVTNGVFSVAIGAVPGTITGNLLSTVQGSTDLWLEVVVNSVALTPRQKLQASPYALAVAAGSVGSAELKAGAVTDAKIADVAIGKITGSANDPNFITGLAPSKINAGNLGAGVSVSSINANTVGSAQIINGAVTDADIAGMSWAKLTAVPAGFADGVDDGVIPVVKDGGVVVITTHTFQFEGTQFAVTAGPTEALIALDASTVTLQGNTFNAANRLVKFDGTGSLVLPVGGDISLLGTGVFSGNGSGLTNLTPGSLLAGALPGGVVASSVAVNSVGMAQIQTNAVDSTKIAANAVGVGQIAANAVNGSKISLGGDAAGDLMYYDGSNWARLPRGPAGQVLKMNALGTLPAWDLDMMGSGSGSSLLVEQGGSGVVTTSTMNFTALQFSVGTTGGKANVSLDASSVTLQGNTFNFPNRLIKLDGTGSLAMPLGGNITLSGGGAFSGSGSGLTGLNPGTLSAGTLPSNVVASSVAVNTVGSGQIQANVVDGTKISLGGDFLGDTMYYDGSNWARLPRGTGGQVLKMNAGGTQPTWDTDNMGSGAAAIEDGDSPVVALLTTLDFEGAPFSVTDEGSGEAHVALTPSSVTLQGNTFNAANRLVKLDGAGSLAMPAGGNIAVAGSGIFSGDGSGLTSLLAAELTGMVPSANLDSSSVTKAGNTFNIANRLVKLDGLGNLPASNGSALTSLSLNNLSAGVLPANVVASSVALNAVSAGQIASNAVDGSKISLAGEGAGAVMYFNGTDWVQLPKGAAGQALKMNAGATQPAWDTDISGSGSATVKDGDSSVVLSMSSLDFEAAPFVITDEGSGEAHVALAPSSVTLQGNTFNAANSLVKLDGAGNLPALNAAALTGLNPAGISAGTLPSTVAASSVSANAVGTSQIAANAVDGSKIAMGGDFTGDLMFYNGADWARLPRGSAGQVLKMNTGGALPQWDLDNMGTGGGGSAVTVEVDGIGIVTTSTMNFVSSQFLIDGASGKANLSLLGSSVTLQGNQFNLANRLLKLDPSAFVPDTNLASGLTRDTEWDSIAKIESRTGPSNIIIGGEAAQGDMTGSSFPVLDLNDNSVDGTEIALGGDTTGDLMVYNGVDWVKFSPGASGNVLKSAGAGALPTWQPDSNTIYDGDAVTINKNGSNQFSALGSSVTLQGNTFNAANSLVKLDTTSRLPAVNGSLLTNVPAVDLTCPDCVTLNGETSGNYVAAITAGAGISVTAGGEGASVQITNAGDADASNDVTTTMDFNGAGSDVSGVWNNLTLKTNSVDGTNITLAGEQNGDLMYYDSGLGNWVRLGGAANGSLLKSNGIGTIPGWQTGYDTNLSLQLAGATFSANPSSATLQGNIFNAANRLLKLDGAGALAMPAGGNIALSGGGIYSGDGSGLTNLQATALTGLVPNASLDGSSVTKAGNSFNAANGLVKLNNLGHLIMPANGNVTLSGSGIVSGNGSGLTNLPLAGLSAGTLPTTVVASSVAANAIGSSQLAGNAVDGSKISLTGENAGAVMYFDGTNWVQLPKGQAGQVLKMNTGATLPQWDMDIVGTLGGGGSLLVKSGGTGVVTTSTMNYAAQQFTVGNVGGEANIGLDNSSVTLQGNAFNAANRLVKLDGAGNLPALNASALTGYNPANMSAGTLPSNVVASALSDNIVTGAKISLASEAAGDVMYFNGTDWVRLPKGAAGEVLKMTATQPQWGSDNGGNISVQLDGTAVVATSTMNYVASQFFIDGVGGKANVSLLASSVTLQGNQFNAPNKLLKLDGSAYVPTTHIDAGVWTRDDDWNTITKLQAGAGGVDFILAAESAGGDLVGTFPNPTVADNSVDGSDIALGGDTAGDLMIYDGVSSNWVKLGVGASGQFLKSNGTGLLPAWAVDNNTTYAADGVSLDLTGATFSARPSSVTLQGNTFNQANSLVKLDSTSRLPAANGSLLTNVPAVDLGCTDCVTLGVETSGNYVATIAGSGAGITVTGSGSENAPVTIQNTGDTNPGDDLLIGTAFSGDVAGAYNTLTVQDNSVDGTDITLAAEQVGDLMVFDGTNWARLGPGAAGTVLKSNGAGAAPAFQTGYLADGTSLLLTGSTFSANPSSVTLQGNAINQPNGLAKLDGSGDLAATVTVSSVAAAAVGSTQLASDAVTSVKIQDGAIMDADINASAAIAKSKLNLANSILAGDLADNAVTGAKISITGEATGGLMIYNGTTGTWEHLTVGPTSGQVLKSNGTGTSPFWGTDATDDAVQASELEGLFSAAPGLLRRTGPNAFDTVPNQSHAQGHSIVNTADHTDWPAGVDTAEVGHLNGVTSAIQTQLNAKEATITGAATSITGANLTVSRALVSDGSGKVSVSATVDPTELGYLDLVTSPIQTQLNNKAAFGHNHDPDYVSIGTQDTITAVHVFNPSAPGAPFTLGANANAKVTNFDADKLDGFTSGDFAPVVHNHNGVYELFNANIQSHISAVSNVHGLTFTAEGSNGGLDADTVDGKHYTDMAPIVHTHSYAGSSSAGGPASDLSCATNGCVGTVEIAPGTAGQILITNATPAATWIGISGDGSLSSGGALTVNNDSHDHTGTTIGGLSPSDFTAGTGVAQWTNDANYTTAAGHSHDAAYVNATSADVISAVHTFTPGSAGPPFILGASAQDQKVNFLNADLLDGISSAGFAASGHLHPGTYEPANANIQAHISAVSNVHGLTFTAEGTGGGLDADTVDGQHAAAFAPVAHVSTASGVHGITGSVVGTTDTQTLSAKTLTNPNISDGSNPAALLKVSYISSGVNTGYYAVYAP